MTQSAQSLKSIFEQALLTRAAYADLSAIAQSSDPDELAQELALVGPDQSEPVLSVAAANYLATRFAVVDHLPNTSRGYSATLFVMGSM